MSLQPQTRYSVQEYLRLEAETREKHEYLDGEIFAMGCASEAHNLIVLKNCATSFGEGHGEFIPATCA